MDFPNKSTSVPELKGNCLISSPPNAEWSAVSEPR